MNNIVLEVLEGNIGLATLDMPGRPVNVFSEEMMDDLERVVDQAANKFNGLVIRSGKSTFVAGADLGMIKDFANMRFDADWQTMRDRFSRLGKLFRKIERSPVPIVAAVNGLALGGGLELAMACHARVCIDTPAPILGLPEILLALLPGAGGTQRLPRYIGLEPAVKMLLDGGAVSPGYALEHGLVDCVVPKDELITRALELAKSVSPLAPWDRPGWQVPEKDLAILHGENWFEFCLKTGGWSGRQHDLYPAVRHIIECVGKGVALPIDEGFDVEWDIFVDLMSDPVAANMVVTCFLNKTAAPKWAQSRISEKSGGLTSVSWQSDLEIPKPLTRTVAIAEGDNSDLVVEDCGRRGYENSVELCDVTSKARPSSEGAAIGFSGSLKSAEVVELRSDKSLAALVLGLATGMGKVPVWRIGHSGLDLIYDAVRAAVGSKKFAPGKALGLAHLIDADNLFTNAGFCADSSNDVSRDQALQLLAEIALIVWEGCEGRYEEVDVLAVLGAGWPKWTGGPIAYLAMIQRGELAGYDLANAKELVNRKVGHDLKVKASYNCRSPG